MPDAFSYFSNRSKCNGAFFREKIIRNMFLKCVEERDICMKKSFKLHHDYGHADYDAYKFSQPV